MPEWRMAGLAIGIRPPRNNEASPADGQEVDGQGHWSDETAGQSCSAGKWTGTSYSVHPSGMPELDYTLLRYASGSVHPVIASPRFGAEKTCLRPPNGRPTFIFLAYCIDVAWR